MAKKKTKTQEGEELKETAQRLQAEFENFKKRTEQEKQQYKNYAVASVVGQLLPLVDNFSLALKAHEQKDGEFYKGVELLYAQLMDVLKNHGVTHIDAQGKQFDPQLHEALLTKKSEKQPGTVLEVMQEGYMINEKVLRPAKVCVSKE